MGWIPRLPPLSRGRQRKEKMERYAQQFCHDTYFAHQGFEHGEVRVLAMDSAPLVIGVGLRRLVYISN